MIYGPPDGRWHVVDAHLRDHSTRSVLDAGQTYVPGVAGLGIATYTFEGYRPYEVRALIYRYERKVEVIVDIE